MMAIFFAGLICYFMFGCTAAPPLYVIDAQKLAGAMPDTADQLIKEMVSCELRHEERWEEGHWIKGEANVFHIGKLYKRRYEIENDQIDGWQRKPMVELYFDADYEERVNGIKVDFIEQVSPIDALRRLGYDPDDAWHFITREYLHQIYLQDTGETTAVTIHLDTLTH